MNKRSIKMAVIFSLLIFAVLSLTSFLSMIMTARFFRPGMLRPGVGVGHFSIPMITSVLAGCIISYLVTRRPIRTAEEISKATKAVAKGDFSIRLDEKTSVSEFREMANNFNIMVKELEGTEMLRKDFIENVSHEFKTPLAAIEGYTTLLQKKDLSEEKREEYIRKILFSTHRLNSLTGNILLLSRLEKQETEISKKEFSLDEQIRESLLLLENDWSEKNLDLDIQLSVCNYYGNEELLAHVWQNIIGNAIKFVPTNGAIAVKLFYYQRDVIIMISDSGPGMNEETMKRVFEKFYQGDSSRSTGGNGLGLALAKRIIDLHSGEIFVHSEVGKGTAFTVRLSNNTNKTIIN